MTAPETNTTLKTSAQAAEILGFSEYTIRLSRATGTLAGVEAPPFIKMGRNVRYKKSDLDNWLAQFQTFTNTAQAAMAVA
ncbi:Helix-turn-helix domain-containing protein [Oceanospirillum multiglobuliferum]|uniref:Helix-turn-helix domain-containing protein n=1 Tax=Oceanospirillum multiglobuliferum TaxID=64969 RepID=A0A1T4QDM8_9GAMM|nr:helix-turn-helix domain-containing protein [Oceanospirillum multiglobuliferum]OPX56520.1 hypothetical protein BTE48_03595 [Oceanospirillum multiglobuliferum]SKA01348.1 Helix-turn-helix domain-containing protein [Oceanospirillum multiglobuliferum]